MRELYRNFQALVNYFFPYAGYAQKKITDKRWVRFFSVCSLFIIPLLYGFMAMVGVNRDPKVDFFDTFQGHIFCISGVLSFIFLIIAGKLKKAKRSPAIPLMIATVFPLWCLLIIMGCIGLKSSHRQWMAERNAIAQEVANKIAERRQSLSVHQDRFAKIEKHLREVRAYLDDPNRPIGYSWENTKKKPPPPTESKE